MEIPLNPGFAVAAFLTEWKMSFELDTTQLFLRIKCVFFLFFCLVYIFCHFKPSVRTDFTNLIFFPYQIILTSCYS